MNRARTHIYAKVIIETVNANKYTNHICRGRTFSAGSSSPLGGSSNVSASIGCSACAIRNAADLFDICDWKVA